MGRALHTCLLAFLTLPLLGSGVVRPATRHSLPPDIKAAWRDANLKLQQRRYLEVSIACERLAARVHNLGNLEAESELLATAAGAQSLLFQYRRAMQSFLRARECAERAGHDSLAAMISFNLSNVYFHLGAWRESQTAAARADPLTRLSGKPEYPIGLHLHRARLAARLDGISAARPHLDAALQLARASADAKLIALVHSMAANEYYLAGDWPEAERAARTATSLRRASRDPLLSSSLLTLSRIRLSQGDAGEALSLAEEAVGELSRHAPQRPLYRFFQYRGEALAALGRLQEARRDLITAVEHLRPLRPELLQSEAIGLHAAATHQEVFSSLASTGNRLYEATGDQAYLAAAFQSALENRAVVMRSLIGRHNDPDAVYAGLLATLQKAELAALRDASPPALSALSEARLHLAEFQLSSHPDLPNHLAPAPLDRILRTLAPDAAVIVLQAGPHRSYAWTLARGRLHLSLLPPESHLLSLTTRHQQLLEQDSPDAAQAGHALYSSLFSSLPPAARQCRRWMILPDRFLFSIPYAALVPTFVDGQPRYLVEEVALQISPFLAPPQSATGRPGSELLAAFADPIYNTADQRATTRGRFPWFTLASRSPTGNEAIALPRLPGTAQEIRTAAEAWHGPTRLHSGAQVTLANLRLALA
ncbi:MAG: hypothetical protein J0L64_24890, partial [Acidobacteria bacterium]|nr:hypothetical protein [Acidobacteriota bacterium]